MPNKTIFVSNEDKALWKKAKKLLAFYQDKTPSAFVMEKIREYVIEEEARQATKRAYPLTTEEMP